MKKTIAAMICSGIFAISGSALFANGDFGPRDYNPPPPAPRHGPAPAPGKPAPGRPAPGRPAPGRPASNRPDHPQTPANNGRRAGQPPQDQPGRPGGNNSQPQNGPRR